MAAVYAPVFAMLAVLAMAAVCCGAHAGARDARVLQREADEFAKAPVGIETETATLAAGLPDNDHFRRRLFFIGDLATDFVREPSRLLLPPPGSVADAVEDLSQGTAASNYAAEDDDQLSGELLVHEKDYDGQERRGARPAQRGHTARDQEIRQAMEDSEDFQGPLLGHTAGKDRDGHREGRRQTFRWSVVDTAT
ncbi:uncharacterized protein LOC117650675 [Thrips palmi]|uniref:Uncharacterized protein LOC117650675 n=1 Tax=Thrips palmi TaxID=161013 RepID=A0A6P8ZZI2_THRPL|nr:uncharacterized protein LOC117650675 [Thrips palmi]